MKKIFLLMIFVVSFGTLAFSQSNDLNVEETAKDTVVKNIPEGYVLGHFAKDRDYNYYYIVIKPDYKDGRRPISEFTGDWRVFRGKPNRIEETHVFTVEMFRDGGSVIIQTMGGTLYFPTRDRPRKGRYLDTPKHNMFDDLIPMDRR